MPRPFVFIRFATLATACAVVSGVSAFAGGKVDPLDALIAKSPFVPADTIGAKVVAVPSRVEFGGYLDIAGKTEVSLFNTATGESAWVALRDKSAPYFVESLDPAAPAVVVKLDGLSVRLTLRSASDAPAVAVGPVAPLPQQATIHDAGAPPASPSAAGETPPGTVATPTEPNRIPRQTLRIPKRADDPA